MNKFSQVTDIQTGQAYAFVIVKSDGVNVIPALSNSNEWAEWANQTCKSFDDIQESLSYDLQCELPVLLNDRIIDGVKSLLKDEQFAIVSDLAEVSSLEMVDAVGGHGRRYAIKSLETYEPIESPTTLPLRSFASNSRQSAINYKALTFRAESTFSEVTFEVKRARALWDPDLGPSGGWRCPTGTQYGGYITDRFGRGCGGGALRRVGRALVNAGRGIDKLGQRRDARRLNRAAERAQRGETRRERAGAAVRRGVGAVSNALERGAQRLVGEYQPRDYDPRTGRMRRRGVNAPEISRERRNAINSRLVEIRDELDDLADKPRNPANVRRENELIEENRRLRRERDGASPKRVARVRQAPAQRRVVAPAAGQRKPRQQGARPVRKPVAERGRENRRQRLARRLVGEYQPNEYKPGDKKRIKNRKNRYADVSDAQLRRALANRSPKRARPGEARDVEARRRQDRLEILQEMLNRGMEIPDQYKREVRQYRLKPQRQRRGDGLNRVGRAAVGLERAAQRVERPRKPRTARNRREEQNAPGAPKPLTPGRVDAPNPKLMEDEDLARIVRGGRPQRNYGGNQNEYGRKLYDDVLAELQRRYPGLDIEKEVLARNFPPKDARNTPEAPSNRPTARPRTDIPSNRPPLTRERRRQAVTNQGTASSLRRPMPKRLEGDAFDMDALDRDQKIRMRNLLKTEKAELDAEWRKRLGLRPSEQITDKAIKDYIKEREGNKPGAYIGVLKAKANDWKVLSEWQKQVDDRPAGANLIGENEMLNRIGPKRRVGVIKKFNGGDAGIPNIDKKTPKPRIIKPNRTPSVSPEADVVRSLIHESNMEAFSGSMPDERSRRNVRNRFPNNGLPEKAFWRAPDYEGRNENDRADHERRFGRYYDSNGKLNARGRLVNRQLKSERDRLNEVESAVRAESKRPSLGGRSTSPLSENRLNAYRERQGYLDFARQVDEGLPAIFDNYRLLHASGDKDGLEQERVDNQSVIDSFEIGIARLAKDNDPDDLIPEYLAILDGLKRRNKFINDLGSIPSRRTGRSRRTSQISPMEQAGPGPLTGSKDPLKNPALAPVRRDPRYVRQADRYIQFDALAKEAAAWQDEIDVGGLEAAENRLRQLDNDVHGWQLLYQKYIDDGQVDAISPVDLAQVEYKQKLANQIRQALDVAKGNQASNARSASRRAPARNDAEEFLPPDLKPSASPRKLGKNNLEAKDAAVEHIYVNGGALADIPDGIVIDVIIEGAVDGNGVALRRGALDKGLPRRWENDRFVGTRIKGGGGSGGSSDDDFGNLWEVHRITDKKTGEVWYLKTSDYGVDDALMEQVGAASAEALEFGNRLDHIRVGEWRDRKQKPGRWIMMRDIAQMDHGQAAKGAKFADAGDVHLDADDRRNINPRDAARMAVLDFILGNQDRHPGNFQVAIVGNDVRLAMIDMGLVGGGRAEDYGFEDGADFIEQDLMGVDIQGYADQFNNGLKALRRLGYNHALQNDARKRELFAKQAERAVQRLYNQLNDLFSVEKYEANGVRLTSQEKAHLDAMRRMAEDRIQYLLSGGGLTELVRFFG